MPLGPSGKEWGAVALQGEGHQQHVRRAELSQWNSRTRSPLAHASKFACTMVGLRDKERAHLSLLIIFWRI
jgi:hypothetical protein